MIQDQFNEEFPSQEEYVKDYVREQLKKKDDLCFEFLNIMNQDSEVEY